MGNERRKSGGRGSSAEEERRYNSWRISVRVAKGLVWNEASDSPLIETKVTRVAC